MKYKILIVLFLTLIVSVLIFSNFVKQPKIYNCDMAEWHLDVPNAIKEECRRIKNEYRNNQQQKFYI